MENSTELTKEQECSDCMLGVTQAELFSPFAYSNASAAELSSRASACGKPTFTVTEPKPYALSTTSPTATEIPSLRSKDCPDRYQVRAGDTCQSVSQAHNVSTFGLLYWNNLAVGCTDFPKAGRAVCLPSPCPIYTIQQNDTCLGIIAHHAPDYSMRQLRSWNMNINNVCSNLEGMVGDQICIGPPALLASVALPASTPTATPVATPVAVPTNAATGSNPKCGLWYTTISGDICSTISGQYSISLKNFYFLNPAVDNKCSNLQREVAYCVRPVGDITTYPSYDGAGSGTTAACDAAFPAATCYQDPATLPSVPFLEANATFARPTSASVTTASRTLSRTTHVPSPTAPGSRTDCLEYARYVTTGDKTMEKAINSCSTVAQYYGVTVDQLLEWNAILKPENCGLLPRYVYCAYVEGGKSPLDDGLLDIRHTSITKADFATL
jgi:LysM repeat protein